MIKDIEDLRRKFESSIIKEENGCWIWIGVKHDRGYGRIAHNGTTIRANRLSMHLYRGFDLDSELWILHRCNNTSCVNYEHLYIGDAKDNARDTIESGHHSGKYGNSGGTHCSQGHEYNAENTYYYKNKRLCKICDYYRRKRRYEANKARGK